MQHIATAAGVTRGAVYWHFVDKAALLNALLERAKMPLESAMRMLDTTDPLDPVHDLHEYAMCVFRLTAEDPRARRAFEIATLKLEWVGELTAVFQRRQLSRKLWNELAISRLRIAQTRGQLKAGVDPAVAALGLWALIDGLVRGWLMEQDYDLVTLGAQIIETHLAALRA